MSRCCDSVTKNRRTKEEIWTILNQMNFEIIDEVDSGSVIEFVQMDIC
jgi:hypothetical protein